MNETRTRCYARLHSRGLTVGQQSAVDLLATGKTDTEVAELLNINRVTVTRWRCYDPLFQAELNRRRAEIWASGIDKLQALIPKALDALAESLDSGHPPTKFKAARAVLALAKLPVPVATGLTDAEEIIAKLVTARIKALLIGVRAVARLGPDRQLRHLRHLRHAGGTSESFCVTTGEIRPICVIGRSACCLRPRSDMAHCDAAGVNGSNRIISHGAPLPRMMPNGCLGSPVLVLLRS